MGIWHLCNHHTVIAIAILSLLWINQRKAEKEGTLVREKSGRTISQSVSFYFWEFDGEQCPICRSK